MNKNKRYSLDAKDLLTKSEIYQQIFPRIRFATLVKIFKDAEKGDRYVIEM